MHHHVFMIALGMALMCGCTQTRQTDPLRTATELYLLSTAVDSSVKSLQGEGIRGRSVYIDSKFLSDKDNEYLIASVRAKLLHEGVLLKEKREDAEVVVEIRSPGVSIDSHEYFIGIPGLPIGQLAVAAGAPPTTITTPELALIKSVKQWGTAGIAYVAYWRDTGEVVATSGPHIGRSFREDWLFVGVKNTLSDIPPARPPERDEAEAISQD